MRFESQTHPQDDHIGRITDCSTRYGQARAVSTRVRVAKGRCHRYSGFKEIKGFLLTHFYRFSIAGTFCDRKVACSASDCQGSNFESCVWRAVLSGARFTKNILSQL